MSTFITPPAQDENVAYAFSISSSGNMCVSSGARSVRWAATSLISLVILSLPPGNKVVTIVWSARPATQASTGMAR